ncbi:phosphoadenylylsulfate reductase (thioredoxin) [Stackebrandtia albiflava]|uniref:Adenosine 5'-phosphosulfate reductase n=1 Tax=Stackebrandtia albiflava TaxID=406432 RepID=A0A562V5I4_9ACTN|nr:phosphoadenylyl-sulfate reductase [Stackebrandtia albiflava]TWJ13037.1 phosphoadenylylsulfate reductase (thioredoxin) [Stackebrandtia albiflava]
MNRDPFALRDLARRADRELEGATAHRIVEWAATEFGEAFCVTSSFADAVLVHLVSQVAPGVDVVFLDTGLHFAETLGVREHVTRRLPVTVRSVTPAMTVRRQDGEFGPRLWERDPDECCAMRKVAPLADALERYDAWATGLRRDESPTRADTRVVDFDASRRKVKISPIAAWTQRDVDEYVAAHDIPVNPLLDQGYGSVGCWPCTRRTAPGEDPRAGRWAMFEKTECGIHG